MSKLVIIESAGKIQSFRKALGKDYQVVASYGHCVDLPVKGLSVNIKKDFEPTFEVTPAKKDVVASLRKMAKAASAIYLMTDEDREGEAIAWHLKNELESYTKAPFLRASTNEVTKAGIEKALANPGDINDQMIDAYLCRRLLDRLCGYKTSFLTKQATGGRSAGRVQSAMLHVIVSREKEIMHFVPKEYWVLTGNFNTLKGLNYLGILDEKIEVPNEATALQICKEAQDSKPFVSLVESKDATLRPYAPFTTSTMIQAAGSMLGWTAAKVMKTAQGLYEAGHITYMRTDSPSMAKEAVTAIRDFVLHEHGDNYLHSSVRTYSAKKGSQEGHECCRPTHIEIRSASGTDANKLYTMIWCRAVACQMSDGKDKRTKIITRAGNYDFISKGNIRLFDGFRKVWNYSKHDDVTLPTITEGEKVTLLDIIKEQKWTTPPPRYSDASLQKKCDALQIARPATFTSFLSTLEKRGYIVREKKSFKATDLGIRVIDFLVQSKMCFVDLKFTAQMETFLDEIASGNRNKLQVLTEFWEKLKQNIEDGKKVKEESQKTSHKCPVCKGILLLKHSDFGSFLSCENFSRKEDEGCKYKANIDSEGNIVEKVVKEKEYAAFSCQHCNSKMIKRVSKFGEFWGCESYPSCRGIADLNGTFKPLKKGKKSYSKKKKSKKIKKAAKNEE